MTISVIVPCYNAVVYLEECLHSLQQQSFTDFEALLVDDGSTDATLSILEGFAAVDARFKVLRQPNKGVSAARNLAMDRAQGEWLFFLDADDVLPKDAFESLLAAALEGMDLIVGAHGAFTSEQSQLILPERERFRANGWSRHEAALRLIEGDSVLNIMCNKLHRRALIEHAGIRLDDRVAIAEDALFNLEAILAGGERIAFVPKETYRYRMHGASVMHQRTGSAFELHLPWLLAMGEMLEQKGLMPAYYGAYLDSVILRLYKDGGVPEVWRRWKDALRLVRRKGLDMRQAHMKDRMLYHLIGSGLYPVFYPAICLWQIIERKLMR